MLFVQSLIICLQNLKKRMCELVHSEKTNTQEFMRLNLVLIQTSQMMRYIVCGDWGGARTREVFAFWLKTNYNAEQTAQRFRMPVQTVEQLVKQADKAISGRLEKPLQMLCSGKIYEGTVAFYTNISKPMKGKKCVSKKKVG